MKNKELVAEIFKAIADEGVNPKHHQMVMAKHRKEWPKLWKALDKLIKSHGTIYSKNLLHNRKHHESNK